MQPVYDFLRPYWPTLLFFVVFPVLAAIANWLLWWDTPERWDAFAAKHPERARAIRILRTIAPHLRKLVVLWRDGAASKGAPQAVRLLSPRVEVLADKAGAVAVSETRGAFDPAARQTIAPDVVATAQRIARESERGFATVRALLALVVMLAVALPLGAALTGCPNWNRPACPTPGAYSCVHNQPHYCGTSRELTPMGDEPCDRAGRVCAIDPDGTGTCVAAVDGGVR